MITHIPEPDPPMDHSDVADPLRGSSHRGSGGGADRGLRTGRPARSSLLPLGLLLACANAIQPEGPSDPTEMVFNALESYQVVAIGEAHGLRQQHDWLQSLVTDPRLPARARHLVVEFGNSLHQSTVDRYVAGEDVPAAELQAVWRNTTQALTLAWEQQIYGDFFRAVRDVNADLEPSDRLRVLLADPPIDWDALSGPGEYAHFMADRDRFFAQTVIEQVLRQGHRAILISGSGHFRRVAPSAPASGVVSLIEAEAHGSVFVMHPVVGFGPETTSIEARLADWPTPSAVSLDNSWLGSVDASLGIGVVRVAEHTTEARPTEDTGRTGTGQEEHEGTVIRRPLGTNAEARPIEGGGMAIPLPARGGAGDHHEASSGRVLYEGQDLKKSDIAHALVYFGPKASLTYAEFPASLLTDTAYWAELERRALRATGRPLAPGVRAAVGGAALSNPTPEEGPMPSTAYDTLMDIAADQHGYVTTAQARTHGVTPNAIRMMAHRGALERVSWGVYRVPTFPPSPFAHYMEACLWPAGAMGAISHESALAIRELSDVNPSKIHLTVPKHFRVRREIPRHLVVHNADLADEELASVEGVPTTSVRRAIEDCHRKHLGPALLRQAIEDGQRQGYLRAVDAEELRERVLG